MLVSDIHVSRYYAHNRAPDLLKFCQQHLHIINPDFVIATGDLTDAKAKDLRGSRQYEDEWKKYQDTISECMKLTGTKWLDLRGNHDTFDVPHTDHSKNFYRKYSMQGRRNPGSYIYTHKKPYGNYSFVAMDACPDPGPRRPFNFFGYLKQKESEVIKILMSKTTKSNLTITFGHYPTSLIIPEDGHSVRYLISNSVAYLCGHLHTLAGAVPHMYARHRTGTIELEVGDWKDNRIFRILAVDHDLLSFTDEQLGNWPLVIITNPKHALFLSPKEPTSQIAKSTHIRILVFSPDKVEEVTVYIDNSYVGKAEHIEGPLFVLKWEPSKYDTGLHNIKVTVEDVFSREKVISQPFSIDGTQPGFAIVPRLILMLNIFHVGKSIFLLLLIVYILLMLFLRKFENIKSIYLRASSCLVRPLASFVNCWLLRIWLVAKCDALFYSLTLFILYVAIGPWFVAELLEDHLGVVFIWGMYVNGSFLPGSLAYFYGVFQIITFHIPLLMYLGYMMLFIRDDKNRNEKFQFLRRLWHLYIPFGALLIFQTFITLIEFPAAYGTKAMVLGPVRTGSVFLALISNHIAKNNALKIRQLSSHRS